MKKLIALFLTLMCLAVPALAELPDLTQYTDEELRLLRDQINVTLSERQLAQQDAENVLCSGNMGDFHVAVLAADLMRNYEDKPCVIYTFQFTNNSEDTLSMNGAVVIEAYQNGISCALPLIVDGVNTSDFALVKLRPGASYTVYYGFLMTDEVSPVEFEMWARSDYSKKNGVLRYIWNPTAE